MNVVTAPTNAPLAPKTQAPVAYKPHTEQWSVDGQTDAFTSTASLVAQGESLSGKRATYTYTKEPAPAPFTPGEKFANAVGMGLQGAAIGAGAGAVVGVVLTFIAGVGDVLGGIMGGRMSGVSSAVMLVPVALGAGIGAVGGGVSGYKSEGPGVEGGSVSGTLQARDGKVLFYPGGQVDEEVNLSEFQSAGEAPLIKPALVRTNAAWNAIKGAAIGAAVVPGVFAPIVGMGAGGYVGFQAGKALDQRTELGKGVGLTLGLATTAASVGIMQLEMMSAGQLKAAGALAGVLGVTGAVLGNKVFNARAQKPEHHEYGAQWWNKNEGQATGS